ncbi:hypothetical protein KRR39_22015 [Nocardioides panacis]|uniref:DUF3592 domain-containing protein n=1 Tax=Nocardioides panacis TaxID=2849501 RepID=A0A975SY47_9ACTN|nr:hypothetical protein [Nocardioides panacis]QWZ07996.1 hypothetical protein KRR39_22015 [Nocardioides panacis]
MDLLPMAAAALGVLVALGLLARSLRRDRPRDPGADARQVLERPGGGRGARVVQRADGSVVDLASLPDVPRPAAPRRGVAGAVVACVALTLLSGVVPVWMYVDHHDVPAGTRVLPATVVDRSSASRTRTTRNTGSVLTFRLADGRTGSFYAEPQLFGPGPGDRVDVYRQDGGWESPSRTSPGYLAAGLVCLVLWPAITVGYLRSLRRARALR